MAPVNTTTEKEKLELDEGIYHDADSSGSVSPSELPNLLDIALLLAKNKVIVGRITLACLLVSAVTSLFIPNTFTAQSKILPPQQSQSGLSALLGQMSGLSGLLGKDIGLGTKNMSDVYVSILQSRTVADALIARFDLKAAYKKKKVIEAREKLKDSTEILAGKDGVVTITVDDRQPWRAAALANAYVDELYKLNQHFVVTEAGQRRVFFEKELQQAKNNLADAEVALRKTQEETGLIQIDAQAKAIIEGVARLRAQLSAKEVQLQSMRSYATEENSGIKRLEQEVSTLRSQLETAERGQNEGNGNIQLPTGRIPRAALEYVRKLRDVKYYETLFEIMAKQFELAKTEEAKSAAMVQVLDIAVPPEKKSKPYRLIIVLVSTFLGLALAIAWVLGCNSFARAQENALTRSKVQRLTTYLNLRR